MPLVLTTPETASIETAQVEITSFAIDATRNASHVGYRTLNGSGVEQSRRMLVISGADFGALNTRAGQIAVDDGVSVFVALRRALLEQIAAAEGWSGSIS